MAADFLDNACAPSAEESYGLEDVLQGREQLCEKQYSAFRQHWYTLQARDFLFFQAEDCIRYLTVTGVQTCALPISPRAETQVRGTSLSGSVASDRGRSPGSSSDSVHPWSNFATFANRPNGDGRSLGRVACTSVDRSEERRVGKECRSRW